MSTKDKLICALYALIAIVALPATWINNIAFMNQEQSSFLDFVHGAYANAAAASLSNDVFLVAFAAIVFMAIEGRHLKIRFVWLYILLSGLIAISVTFPLFLIARQIKLSNEEETTTALESA